MITGDYYLLGVREVGSGFRFNTDHTFEFFFSYGAVDRSSTGTWERKGEKIVLNTPRKPASDFILTTSKKLNKKQLTVRVKDANPRILRYIYCRIETADGTLLETYSDNEGVITFDEEVVAITSISLLHEFWGDRLSEYKVEQHGHNYFEFTIAPWITNVEFIDLALHYNENGLTGEHPLLPGDKFKYVNE